MGVERFFSSLKRDYNFIKDVNKKIECEHLLIDFNSIVHISSQFLLSQMKNTTTEIFEATLIDKVGDYILDMLNNTFYPRNLITISICVDGVPSMSKIFEQKKRRYMGDLLFHLNKLETGNFSWSRNNISPGTDFMQRMMKYLTCANFEDSIRHICHNLKHYAVSGIDMMGEGEIKILHQINAMQKTKYKMDRFVVYSPDSDVIIILLTTDVNVIMLRYDQQQSTNNNPVYNIIDINMYKTILYDYIKNKINKKIEMDRIIPDLVFLMTVFGDDFLPKLETVRVNTDINIILDHYIAILIRYGYLLKKTNLWEIDADNFYQYLILLGKKEEYFLRRNARYHMSTNYHRIVEEVVGANMHLVNNLIKNNNIKAQRIITDYFIEILPFIDGKKLKQIGIYNNSTDYILSNPHTLMFSLIEYYEKTKSLPITIPMKTSHPKIMTPSFNSNDKFHKERLQKIPDIEKEQYMIENKLDGYYKILNPLDNFYRKTYYTNIVNNNNYYQEHFSHINKFTIVKDYLVGLNWVMNYYLNTDPTYKNIDISWYYPHNRSPLLHDIVTVYDKNIITMKRFNPFNNNFMTPIEHFIYVSPFHSNLSETMKKYLGSLSSKQINNIIMFIKANKKYYYDLDTIYKNLKKKREIDCSGSIFISKCHLLFMENYIDMISFLNDIRKYIVL
jgi:5'-3' exonuclease